MAEAASGDPEAARGRRAGAVVGVDHREIEREDYFLRNDSVTCHG